MLKDLQDLKALVLRLTGPQGVSAQRLTGPKSTSAQNLQDLKALVLKDLTIALPFVFVIFSTANNF